MKLLPPFSRAQWIASTIVGGPRTSAPAPYLRKTFLIEQPVQSARLAITALGVYECEINGGRVGDEIFAPGWTEYRKRVQYQIYEVAGYLRRGENVVGAILGDGWYCGYLGWHPRQHYGDRPRLLAEIEIVLEDGSSFAMGSDHSWRTTTGPILESDLLMGESYDARLEVDHWSEPGYDDSHWLPAMVAPPHSMPELSPRIGPPVRRTGEIKPVKESRRAIWDTKYRIFDLGQNFSGRVRISIRATAGTTLKLRFAEVLSPDGMIYTENLRTARCVDYYTCKGGETETYEPRFTFHGFRYVEATSLDADAFLEVTGIVLQSDMPPTGTFRCSHEMLNQLQHNIVWGQKSNFLEVPTDCPQRDERLGWTGDAQVFIRTAAFNMNVQGFFHKWIQDFRDSQRANGGVPCVIPATYDDGPGEDGGPAWADAAIICPWTIYLCYADQSVLDGHYDSMKRFIDFTSQHRCKGLIRHHPDLPIWRGFGDWLALDGSDVEGFTPVDLIGTAFYAHDINIMAKVATVLGRDEDAKKYRILHGEIVDAFRRRFITPDGLVASGTQTAYVLALHFGLVEDSTRATTVRELVRHIEKKKFHLATGFVGTPYILEVLENAGHLDVAYKLLEQETFPSWLFPVKNGATTVWERWDGWTPDKGFQDKGMNSFNHYAYGAVGEWMYRSVAGLELDPADPGYRHIIFRPRPGGTITWAEATLKTVMGEIGIHWELKREALEVKLTVPTGSHATFHPPAGYDAKETGYRPGEHVVTLKKV